MAKAQLKGNALKIFNFVVGYMREHNGRSPTNREIEEGTGIPVSVTHYHINKLCNGGYLTRHDNGPRNLNVPGSRWVYPA